MNDSVLSAQTTIRAMKLMIEALEDIGQRLPSNPKLYAMMADSPLEDLRRMRDELDQHLEQLRQATAAPASSV